MAFGFSSNPSIAQWAQSVAMRTPDAMAMARAAQGGNAMPMPQGAPPADPNPAAGGQQPGAPGGFQNDPGGVNIISQGGIPTPAPYTPGGINLPMGQPATDAAMGASGGSAGASFLSTIASLFGG